MRRREVPRRRGGRPAHGGGAAASAEGSRFVPAAGRAALTPLYDIAMRLSMREGLFRGLLVRQTLDGPGGGVTVLDIGCGTGTLSVALAAGTASARVVGLDADPKVLGVARRKDTGASVLWVQGDVTSLPFADHAFDRVVISLVLHHLADADKRTAILEARRVLRDNGRMVIADWGAPRGPYARAAFGLLRVLDGRRNTRLHGAGGLLALVSEAGFAPVMRTHRLQTAWGTLELLRAELEGSGASG